VQFSAYVTRAFMIAKGTTNQRAICALESMMVPTINGTISIFASVLVLAFSLFPYFRIYFFNMYVLITTLGIANGIILLPVLLSLFGPKTMRQSDHHCAYEYERAPDKPVDLPDKTFEMGTTV